jgi:hypothetical protein
VPRPSKKASSMGKPDQIWRKLKGFDGSVVPINIMTIGATVMVWAYCLWCATPRPRTHHHHTRPMS